MKKLFLTAVCMCFFTLANAGESNQAEENAIIDVVQKFKDAVKTDNPTIIGDYVSYPFERTNPLPDIENKSAFIQNYEYIFDNDLKKKIVESLPSDWEKMGWRGIMLDNGILWLNDNGKLIAINSESEKETKYIKQWLKNDKEKLHFSLKSYKKHILIFKTADELGRIDQITDNKYRLALWNKEKTLSDTPKMIIQNGKVEFHGTANNTTYHFQSDDKSFVFYINRLTTADQTPFALATYDSKTQKDTPLTLKEAFIIK